MASLHRDAPHVVRSVLALPCQILGDTTHETCRHAGAGEENIDLVESLRKSKSIQTITVRHEQAGGFMAATYGRLTGQTLPVRACLIHEAGYGSDWPERRPVLGQQGTMTQALF